jgi:AAA domain
MPRLERVWEDRNRAPVLLTGCAITTVVAFLWTGGPNPTRIYIDNFRSFVNFEYRPETKQLLLGPNGSGKSSLLQAIRYLKLFVKGDSNKFTQSARTRWQDRPLQAIELEASLDRKPFE